MTRSNRKHILENLNAYAQAIDEVLPPEQAGPVNEYVHWMIDRQKEWLDLNSAKGSS